MAEMRGERTTMKNYYEILGVSPNSETEVITAAYKAMMRKYHPGLVTVLCRSPISLCHLGLECERADAAQI
jgi:DnaJ-domain-containing protein 1